MHGKYIYIGCDNQITLTGVRRADTGAYLNTATAAWSVHDSQADAQGGIDELASGTLPYVASSNGVYRGTIEAADTEDLVNGSPYWIRLEATQDTIDDLRILRRTAKYHDESP